MDLLALVALVAVVGLVSLWQLGDAQEELIAGRSSSSTAERGAWTAERGALFADQVALTSRSEAGITRVVSRVSKVAAQAFELRDYSKVVSDYVRTAAHTTMNRLDALKQQLAGERRIRTQANQHAARVVVHDHPFVVPAWQRRVPADDMQWFSLMKEGILPAFRAGKHNDSAYLSELVRVLDRGTPGYVLQNNTVGRVLIAMAKRLDHPAPDASGMRMVRTESVFGRNMRLELTPNLQNTTTFHKARNNGLTPEGAAFRMIELATTDRYNHTKFMKLREDFGPLLPTDVLELIDGVHHVFGDGIPLVDRNRTFAPGFHNAKPTFEFPHVTN